jgi:ABC-type transport system involved in cytochrome bd biosynthesis fused ATPase/permease subunit
VQQLPAISIHGDFSWDPDKLPALTDLSLNIPAGTFVAVVGPTGSGKTSLIAAMLGLLMGVSSDDNMQQQQQVHLCGSTAYVPQAPFILGGTVRENILFGRPWDAAKYAAAVAGAQLEHDFEQLPGGDETELGENACCCCCCCCCTKCIADNAVMVQQPAECQDTTTLLPLRHIYCCELLVVWFSWL